MNTDLEFKIIDEHKAKIVEKTGNQALATVVGIEELLKVLVRLMDERLPKKKEKS